MRLRHETRQERIDRLVRPHRWFAWRPVYVGPGRLVWLGWVERCGGFSHIPGMRGWRWAYAPA
jgi:hypothetical protein